MNLFTPHKGNSYFKAIPFILALPILLCVFIVFSDVARAQEKPTIGKVTISNVDTNFVQNDGSCVLSSYAIVANYFTKQPVSAYFEGYCHHFGIDYTNAMDAEHKYASHFDSEWRKRNCKGYEVILDLHSNATEKCFVEARRAFEAHFYQDSKPHFSELEKVLRTREAFLNVSYSEGDGFHSVTVMQNGDRLIVRNTQGKGLYPVPSLNKIGTLHDCVEYIRK